MGIRAIALGAVVAAALAFVLAGLAAGSPSARRPALRVVDPAPLHVRGSHFRAQEHVRVVAKVTGISVTKRVRASSRGSFAVAFRFGASHCSGLLVIAVGNQGSRATLKRQPLPECMPQ